MFHIVWYTFLNNYCEERCKINKHNSEDKRDEEAKFDEMYIDDQGYMKFLVAGSDDIYRFDVSITLEDPLTGEDIVLNSGINMPTSNTYMEQLKHSDRVNALKELQKANLLLETDSEVLRKLSRVIEYRDEEWGTVVNEAIHTCIDAGAMFFRIRNIWNENIQIENVKDVSYVPDEKKHMIRYGRLNDRKEQIMYLADT